MYEVIKDVFNTEQMAAFYAKWGEAIDALSEKTKTIAQEIEDAVGSKLENAFMGTIRSMMDGVQDWGDMFTNILKDIAAEIIRINVIKGAASSLSGAFGGLFPSAHGNAFDMGRVMAFANGGIVNSPTIFPMANGGTGLMGEAGLQRLSCH